MAKKSFLYPILSILLVVSFLYHFKYKIVWMFSNLDSVKHKIEDAIITAQNKIYTQSDIDLVYTWVDGNDPEWQKEKAKWAKVYGVEYNVENNNCRFADNEELRYSLRSAEKNVPWVKKIYLVTNGQIPKWLNLDNPKIELITHDQIMPKSALPTYNASAIEANLAHIPNLSEKFLYSNDDTFFGRPLRPSFFFTRDGKPKERINSLIRTENDLKNQQYYQMIIHSYKVFCEKYPNENEKPIELIHNITPYLKSDYLNCEKEFQKEFDKASHAKFRNSEVLQRHIIAWYSKKKGNSVFIPSKESDEKRISLQKIRHSYFTLKIYNPKLINFNDNEYATNEDREMLKDVMEELYPQKSSFEK